MANKFADDVREQAKKFIEDTYGKDIAKIRRQLIAFHAKAMKTAEGADSFVDPILLKLIQSKHTTVIVVGAAVLIFLAGLAL